MWNMIHGKIALSIDSKASLKNCFIEIDIICYEYFKTFIIINIKE